MVPQVNSSSTAAILNAVPVASLLLYSQGSDFFVQEANDAYLGLAQVSRKTLLHKSIAVLAATDAHALLGLPIAEVLYLLKQVVQTGAVQQMELQAYTAPMGTERFIQTRYVRPSAGPVLGADGTVESLILSLTEITPWTKAQNYEESQQKRAAQAEQLDERFHAVQQIVHLGYWEYDLLTQELFWSEELYHIWGIPWQREPLTLEALLATVHPEDRAFFYTDLSASLRGEKPHDLEHRILLPDGSFKYVHGKGIVLYDSAGKPIKLEGTVQDITDRKLAENAIKESERKYQELFYDSPLPKWVYDQHTLEILVVNNAAVEQYGYSREEFLKMTMRDLILTEETQLLEQLLQKAAPQDYNQNVQSIHRKKNGKVIHVDISGHSIIYQGRTAVMVICHDLTQMIKAQEALALSNERFRYVMRATNDAIWDWDARADRLEWGEGYHTLFGYGPEENPENIEAWLKLVHPDDLPTVSQCFYNAVQNPSVEVWQQEYRYKMANGDYAMVLERGYIIRDGNGKPIRMVGAMQNITEQKLAERQLKHSEEFRRLVINSSLDAIICLDIEDRITLWNPAAEKIFGWKEEEVLGKTTREYIIPKQHRAAHMQGIKRFVETGEARIMNKQMEMSALNRQQKEFPVEVTIVPIQQQDSWVFCGFIRDISFRKQAELLQQKMTQELYEQNRDLQQFTYIISHNLRAPVANAIGLANLLTKDALRPDMFKRSLAFLKESLLQLDTVLKDVSLILSIRDNKDLLDREPVDLAAVVQQAFESLGEPLHKSHGTITLDLEQCPTVHGNRAYLHSIFYNLLSNAIKYRSAERILHVQVQCYRKEDGHAVIIFSDNGSGFDMAKAGQHIFKLYKRFHTDKRGRGIGLFLVKTHVEAMGGHIEVQSEPQIGTRFTITLP